MKKSKKAGRARGKRRKKPPGKVAKKDEPTISLPAGPIRDVLFAVLDNPRFLIGVGLAMLGGAIVAGKILEKPKEGFEI